jgi:high-affinity Fe2+/Pb2+ permease
MAGVSSSIALGVIFISVYYITRDNLFSGDAAYFFEGVVSLVATVMITVLAFCMLRMWNMQVPSLIQGILGVIQGTLGVI